MILNIAVGGDWGRAESIDDRAFPRAFPQRMEVDYVRMFSRDAGADTSPSMP